MADNGLMLDGSKIRWHQDRLQQWQDGKPVVPITIDMALSVASVCNFKCEYCYAQLQENPRQRITFDVMKGFLDDCAEMGVKGISFVSDGESTVNPCFAKSLVYGHEKGIDMAMGTNGYLLNKKVLEKILPAMTYLRINITAGDPDRYAEIHGVPVSWYHQVCQNIRDAMEIKKANNLPVTIGMQMVLMPEYEDQILPLAKLGKELKPDYLVIKHCSDDENGSLGVDYDGYERMYPILREAESLSDDEYLVKVKWSKIDAKGGRSYSRCYGPSLHLQISGSGLVAPCGMLFHTDYSKYHIGNFVETRFKDIVNSQRYLEVMRELASPSFDAKTMCGSLCLQHKTNEVLDQFKKGLTHLDKPEGEAPQHINFI